jgi:hypothetical protein
VASRPEIDELVSLANDLETGWRSWAGRGHADLRRDRRQNQFAVVNGLCAHAHRLGRLALKHLNGQLLEAMPLVRGTYEFAITAHWAAQTPDGAEAMVNELYRQRTAMSQVMSRSAVDLWREGATSIEGLDRERLASESDASGRSFEQRCNDLSPGGADAYVVYRIMSEQVHAGALVVDNYLVPDESDLGVRLRIDPKPATTEEVALWTFHIAASFVWAGRAVDYFDRRHLRRTELRTAAKKLGISSELKLSTAANMRIAKARAGSQRRHQSVNP